MPSEELFQKAMEELESGNINKGLWAKCFAEVEGDENRAKAKYISTRAEALMSDQKNANLPLEGIASARQELSGGNKKADLLENNETSGLESYAAIKAVVCIFGLYLFTVAQMIFQMKGANTNFSFRVVVLLLGYYLLSGLSRLIKRNMLFTFFLAVIPLAGWGLIIYFAHQENRPPRNF